LDYLKSGRWGDGSIAMLTPRPFINFGLILILAAPLDLAIAQKHDDVPTTGSIRTSPPSLQNSHSRPQADDTLRGCRPWCNNGPNPCDLPEFRVPDNRCLPDW